MAAFGILAASSTAAPVVPDLPRPRPCAVVLVKATMLDGNLSYSTVIVAMGARASKVSSSSCKGGA